MKYQRIMFVSHCILNTLSKVSRSIPVELTSEEKARRTFLQSALETGVQLIQLPCPEFTLYGSSRWGHTKEQFDNPFFRDHCRHILNPYLQQMVEYLNHPEKFDVLAVVGVEGSPSCGVERTCSSDMWGGEFSGREDLKETLASIKMAEEFGVFIEVLQQEMNKYDIYLPILALDWRNPQLLMDLLEQEDN